MLRFLAGSVFFFFLHSAIGVSEIVKNDLGEVCGAKGSGGNCFDSGGEG